MDFTSEVESKVIRGEISHQLQIPLVEPSNKVWLDSVKSKTSASNFQVVDFLNYTNEGKF